MNEVLQTYINIVHIPYWYSSTT